MDPFVSIILPIRNEAAYITRALGAVLGQDYPHGSMEVLVVDGRSTDGTGEAIAMFLKSVRASIPVRVLGNPAGIVPTGMNIALRQARGDIIIRVDGHTVIAPDYVRQCMEALKVSGADNVGGRMNAIGHTLFSNAVAVATSTPFGIGDGRFHFSDSQEWVDTVYMGAWPREVFAKIGFFDEELVRDQDDEFNYRLRASGGRILLDPKIRSEYSVRGSPSSLWRQYFQYGFWKVRVLQKHPRQMSLRQFVPPAFVLALLGSVIFALLSALGQPVFGLPASVLRFAAGITPLLYLLANVAASLITSSKKGWQNLPFLPPVFAILHLSYGFGFLIGQVRFAHRWGDRAGRVPDPCNRESAPS